jgi:hypothetical protein
MKCAIVVPSTRPGAMIDNCIVTALHGGKFDGDIYVVSNDVAVKDVEKFGGQVKFVDTHTEHMPAPDLSIYTGYMAFDKEYDLMLYIHSDAQLNIGCGTNGQGGVDSANWKCEDWWGKLQESWNRVDMNRVWGIGIPIPAGADGKACIAPVNPEHHFGFGCDLYNPLHGTKWSQAHSWTVSWYKDMLAQYGKDTGLSLEHLMFYQGVQRHRWSLIANNGNLINHQYHAMGIDTRFVRPFDRYCGQSYSTFHQHHGISLDHFVAAWFGLTLNLHKEEILNAIHIGDYDSIDYIFNEGSEYINHPNCKRCLELNPDMRHCRALHRPTSAHTTY